MAKTAVSSAGLPAKPAAYATSLSTCLPSHSLHRSDVSRLVGRKAPSLRLPYGVVLPIAVIAEAYSYLSGRDTRVTLEGVRMSRKRMFFSSAKAMRELGYHYRPALAAFEDAVRWFRDNGRLT